MEFSEGTDELYPISLIGNIEVARMLSGDHRIVQTDSLGEKFIFVENVYISGEVKVFHGRIFDAIRSIEVGLGDMIVKGPFGNIHVMYYLNRDIGDVVRRETLEQYADVDKPKYLIMEVRDFGEMRYFTGKDYSFSVKDSLVFEDEEEAYSKRNWLSKKNKGLDYRIIQVV